MLLHSTSCASLATPAALAAAASRLARDGFLLIRSRILEVLARPVTIVFDKTGTLTEGRPTILETRVLTSCNARSEDFYLGLAAEIETASEHVLARAFSRHYKTGAKQAITELQGLGYTVAIASGDREAAVAAVAKKLGINRWHGHLTPADKLKLVDELQQGGETVVMVGDGINDAPVLAAANASIAIDAGTALARASADAVVLGKRLGSVVDAMVVAGRTRRIIRQNIAWAILYNITAVPLAAIGMSVSSLLVVLNALRLQSMKIVTAGSQRGERAATATKEALV